MYSINWTETEKWDYLGKKTLSLLQIAPTKTVLLPLCDNKCDYNKFTKIWQDVVSLIDCIDKSKNTKFTGLNTLLYG